MNGFAWDRKGFTIKGESAFLVSGEFHYFRVPHEDWARRMRLFKEAGGNCIATYVPWVIHEPRDGEIIFGDVPARDLKAFLETAAQEDILVVLRPGPYQYSELLNDGLPTWLLDEHPVILARDTHGNAFRDSSVSYLHPVFLSYARRYYRAFAEIARPYLMENGGPVCMVQVDNELIGIHSWFGSLDYNADTMGFGDENGRYAKWLRAKYGEISAMNETYGTSFAAFAEASPVDSEFSKRDYAKFYLETIAEYADLLRSWLREDGITGSICHNSANPNMNTLFLETVDRMGEGFLLGSDHYYTLGPAWAQNNPTPQYMLRMLYSMEHLRAMGMPPTIFELPAGNLADTPPILKEDLLACYMCNTAVGMKGLNYYIYTGGPNYPGTGMVGDIYDYHAPVSADGTLKDTYEALKEYGLFLKENGWMQRAERMTGVQLGFSWEQTRFQELAPKKGLFSVPASWDMTERGVLYALMAGKVAPEMVPIADADITKPMVIVCASCMCRADQEAAVRFIENGGRLIVLPILPEYDEHGAPCTVLSDYIGLSNIRPTEKSARCVHFENACDFFLADGLYTADLPEGASPIARDERMNLPVGAKIRRGKGEVIWLGLRFEYKMFCQAEVFESLLTAMGAKSVVSSSNRNVYTALWSDGERNMLFVMNLHSAPQKTEIGVWTDGKERPLGEIALKPMEVRPILL